MSTVDDVGTHAGRETMPVRAVVWDGEHLAVDEEVEVRPPGPGEVAVDIAVAGLCHSDLSPIEGRIAQPLPVILGHEAVGRVARVGPGVEVPVGLRVVLSSMRRCGRCRHCRAGRPGLCADVPVTPSPFTRRGETVHQFVRLGAFASRTVVTADQVIDVGEEVADPIAAMLGCATLTAFGAVEQRARLQAGETVLVMGAGGIGLNAVVAARVGGASRIVVVDQNPAKESIARQLGATDFVRPDSTDQIVPAVLDLLPRGADTVLECVGHTGLLEAAIAALAWGGRLVTIGMPPNGTSIDFHPRALFHDQSIMGCRMGSVDPQAFLPGLVRRVLSGEIDLTPLVSAVVPLDGTAGLVDALHEGRVDRGFLDFGLDPTAAPGRTA